MHSSQVQVSESGVSSSSTSTKSSPSPPDSSAFLANLVKIFFIFFQVQVIFSPLQMSQSAKCQSVRRRDETNCALFEVHIFDDREVREFLRLAADSAGYRHPAVLGRSVFLPENSQQI